MISAPGEPPGSRVSTTSMPSALQPLGQQPGVGRLAGALAAFEGDETSAHQPTLRGLRRRAGRAAYSRSAPARNRAITISVTASNARCEHACPCAHALGGLQRHWSGPGCRRARPSASPIGWPLLDRRRHRTGVDDARDQPLAAGLRHHDLDEAVGHQRHVALRAAIDLGAAERLAFGEQDRAVRNCGSPIRAASWRRRRAPWRSCAPLTTTISRRPFCTAEPTRP